MRRATVLLAASVLVLAGCGGGPGPASSSASSPSASARSSESGPPVTTAPPTTTPPTTTPPPTAEPPAPATTAPVVVIDPGHNGGNAAAPAVVDAPVPDGTGGTKPCNTTGTSTDAGYAEHSFTWDTSLRLRDLLTAAGVQVVLTRPDDTGVGPCVDVRGQLGAQVGAAAFVGVHGDGAAPGSRGFHVITSSRDPGGAEVAASTQALAVALRDALTAVEPVSDYLGTDGLDSRPDLAGLNLNTVPAVYVECGNMRNAADAALMSSPEGRQALAQQLATGVLAFLDR
ncbi:N-acetylmuramoyl-L-alanine amidase [Modestobacter sp. Leaf380]|uniref:N-acetylmuramoyl-L-alanine amidase n=1 Tax=Modestobacter sp. Leaf380 TaxID=1736356 RepID=UPI0019106B3E|nr:N-acetylmuramoyl-L-alanine amidase [Modestobacter sp. Leaf380]